MAQSTSGATAELLLITEANPAGIPLGIVQNWSVSMQFHSEVHQACGKKVPQETRFHGVGPGSLQWTKVEQYQPETLEEYGVTPASVDLGTFKPWTFGIYDVERGEWILQALDCSPTSRSISGSPATSLSGNASFVVREFKLAKDLN